MVVSEIERTEGSETSEEGRRKGGKTIVRKTKNRKTMHAREDVRRKCSEMVVVEIERIKGSETSKDGRGKERKFIVRKVKGINTVLIRKDTRRK